MTTKVDKPVSVPPRWFVRTRLWVHWNQMGDDVDGCATLRKTETAVVMVEPRTERGDQPHR